MAFNLDQPVIKYIETIISDSTFLDLPFNIVRVEKSKYMAGAAVKSRVQYQGVHAKICILKGGIRLI